MSNDIAVSVEASGPKFQVVTCNDQDDYIRLDALVGTNPDASLTKARIFHVKQLPDGKTFGLQSDLTKAFLGFGLDNRMLMTRPQQHPPPDAFRFNFQQDDGHASIQVGEAAHIVAADGKSVKDPNSHDKPLLLFVRPVKPSKEPQSIESSWAQQSATISAIGEEGVDGDEENYPDMIEDPAMFSTGEHRGGGGPPKLDNTANIAGVRQLERTGELREALDVLGEEKYDDAANTPADPQKVIKVAKLMCIMSSCVYMRDSEREIGIHKELETHVTDIKQSLEKKQPLSDAARNAINSTQNKEDNATKKIQEVAQKMGLKYMPLCNFSSNGTWRRNGPYCGAFYGTNRHDKPFIVIAFKGTGPTREWVTDFKFPSKDVTKSSPLKGRCHTGFFDGVWKDFPGDLSTTQYIRTILPFQMMRNQLWKLEKRLVRFPTSLRVQLWVTGHSLGGAYATNCWAGVLADMHFMHTTIRDLYTFGSPRVGNKDYSTAVRDMMGFRKSWRFDNNDDIIPSILQISLPTFEGYYHIDTLVRLKSKTIKLGPSELKSKTARTMAVDEKDDPEDKAGDDDGEGKEDDGDGKEDDGDGKEDDGDGKEDDGDGKEDDGYGKEDEEKPKRFGLIPHPIRDHNLDWYWSSLNEGVIQGTGSWP